MKNETNAAVFLLPDLKDRNIEAGLKDGSLEWTTLSALEKDAIKSLQIKCPTCKKSFPPYDSRQGRLRQYCSDVCSRTARRLKNGKKAKWICAICGRWFTCPPNLMLHLKASHKGVDWPQYVEILLKKRGDKSSSENDRKCSVCGRARELKFPRTKYSQCRCIALVNKLTRLQTEFAKETDLEKRKRLARQIGGTRSTLNMMRPELKGKPHLTPPIGTIPPPSPTDRRVEILHEFSGYFARLFEEKKRIYDRYYALYNDVASKNSQSRIISANADLHRALSADNWVLHRNSLAANSVHLFVWALNPLELEQGKMQWEEFRLRVECNTVALNKLRDSFKGDEKEMAKWMPDMRGSFEFPFYDNPIQQCWQRIIVSTDTEEYRVFNPQTLLKLYKLTVSKRPSHVRG